jgi:hypothetical protein
VKCHASSCAFKSLEQPNNTAAARTLATVCDCSQVLFNLIHSLCRFRLTTCAFRMARNSTSGTPAHSMFDTVTIPQKASRAKPHPYKDKDVMPESPYRFLFCSPSEFCSPSDLAAGQALGTMGWASNHMGLKDGAGHRFSAGSLCWLENSVPLACGGRFRYAGRIARFPEAFVRS